MTSQACIWRVQPDQTEQQADKVGRSWVNVEPCTSKLKEFADDNFKLIENGRKLSKQVENTVGKGEIARHKFLLFPQCFQKTCTADI